VSNSREEKIDPEIASQSTLAMTPYDGLYKPCIRPPGLEQSFLIHSWELNSWPTFVDGDLDVLFDIANA
jgi:hypothetical protein